MKVDKRKNKQNYCDNARIMWSNIRRFQYINRLTNTQLAECLNVSERSLYTYDKDPSLLTLNRIQTFIDNSGVSMEELTRI